MYRPEGYYWQWNERNNIEGFSKDIYNHVFTWQPHGSQFTIIEKVPDERLSIRIRRPPKLDHGQVLSMIKFDESWIEIIPNG